MRKIAISDIHGCFLTFKKMLQEVVRFSKEDDLYLLGDYIDRGPGSKQVFDLIFKLKEEGYRIHCLLGNHEEAMLKCVSLKSQLPDWILYGGKMTLDSFGAILPSDIPSNYLDFIRNLDYYFETDNYILVHAGLNFSVAHPLHDKSGMLWSRNWESNVDKTWLNGRTVIYGHTPVKRSSITSGLSELDEKSLLNIDAGCYVNYYEGYGHLCAFDMTNRKLFFQENIDNMRDWRAHVGQ